MSEVMEFTVDDVPRDEYPYVYELYRDFDGELFNDERVLIVKFECGCEFVVYKEEWGRDKIVLCDYHEEIIVEKCEEESYAYMDPEEYAYRCVNAVKEEVMLDVSNYVVEVLKIE